jgi:hydroxylamine reductase (hybrid-cluster protein)
LRARRDELTFADECLKAGKIKGAVGVVGCNDPKVRDYGHVGLVKRLMANDILVLKDVCGACFAVEPKPERAADLILAHIADKRKGLGLSA